MEDLDAELLVVKLISFDLILLAFIASGVSLQTNDVVLIILVMKYYDCGTFCLN